MAIQAASTNVAVVSPQAQTASDHSYVDWAAILAGAVLATAISFVLLSFGSALGLSFTSAYRGEGATLPWLAITVALWVLWVEVSSFMAGAYIAGRMRRRAYDATEHEVDMRDSIHGLLVWATGALVGAVIALAGLAGVASQPGTGVAALSDRNDSSLRLMVGVLFRADQAQAQPANDARRDEVGQILARGATGNPVSDDDKAYASRVIATEAGLSVAEAEARFDKALSEAQAAAERARKIGILLAFLTAASLAVSAAAAAITARIGGNHRDKGLVLPFLFRSR